MYASIRQYKSSDPAEAGRRAKEDFIPIVTEIAGVSAWYIVDGGDGSLTTITLADDQAGVEESVTKAREWVAANVADLIQGEPTVTNGEVMAHS